MKGMEPGSYVSMSSTRVLMGSIEYFGPPTKRTVSCICCQSACCNVDTVNDDNSEGCVEGEGTPFLPPMSSPIAPFSQVATMEAATESPSDSFAPTFAPVPLAPATPRNPNYAPFPMTTTPARIVSKQTDQDYQILQWKWKLH